MKPNYIPNKIYEGMHSLLARLLSLLGYELAAFHMVPIYKTRRQAHGYQNHSNQKNP